MADETQKVKGTDTNPDPITGEPGSHPVGTGVGAAGAGATGAVIGTAVGGPVGGAIGAVIGSVAGGLAGHEVAESIDPTVEDAYWSENYRNRPYYDEGTSYDEYRPAYRYGWESRSRHSGRKFDEVESDLGRGWDNAKAESRLGWEKARLAARDAWDRVERAMPGDLDNDGR